MIRATTPGIVLRIRNVDLTEAENVYVSIRQGGAYAEFDKTELDITTETDEEEVTTTVIEFHFDQPHSLGFVVGAAKIQVNFLYMEDGRLMRSATKVRSINISEQLLDRVVMG